MAAGGVCHVVAGSPQSNNDRRCQYSRKTKLCGRLDYCQLELKCGSVFDAARSRGAGCVFVQAVFVRSPCQKRTELLYQIEGHLLQPRDVYLRFFLNFLPILYFPIMLAASLWQAHILDMARLAIGRRSCFSSVAFVFK